MKKAAVFVIDIYKKLISGFFPCACRFHPTCASYAKDAILKKGFLKGIMLAGKRLLKCHPFSGGGYDPVR